jgi:hypothetical protein
MVQRPSHRHSHAHYAGRVVVRFRDFEIPIHPLRSLATNLRCPPYPGLFATELPVMDTGAAGRRMLLPTSSMAHVTGE